MARVGRIISGISYGQILLLAVAGISLLIVVCSGTDKPAEPVSSSGGSPVGTPALAAPATATLEPTGTSTQIPPAATLTPASPTPQPDLTPEPAPAPGPQLDIEDEVERARAERLRTIWGWDTNLNQRNISLGELQIVLPRDRITPIDAPTFAPVSRAPEYMKPREPVVAVIVNGDSRAYPLAMLMWHEIVNDTVGGLPVTVTFCPLCNTGITFERVVNGEILTFGTSGMLRNSDLVMWDRQTQSWWQQITGEALAGDYAAADTVLKFVPSSIIAFETFVDAYPDGVVLERQFTETGLPVRSYDNPPYAGYDNIDDQPFLFNGTIDDRLVATSRVLTIDGEIPVAYPFSFLVEVLSELSAQPCLMALSPQETST
ncbi:MAG: DUF3179 domain-containing (seleno)protein, partial [Chloroflexi bacterium]|nr:DUF3179 domain-containing (seleno)protein [Chloroflexota bacterium]